jgi:hypothetical protein
MARALYARAMARDFIRFLLALCLWITSLPDVTADSYRCGRTVVRNGDPVLKLLTVCGEPRLRAIGEGFIRIDGVRKKARVQRWYYTRSNRSLEHVVLIYGGRIAAIEVGGRRPVRAADREHP